MATAQPERAFVFLTEVAGTDSSYPPPITVKPVKKSGFGWLDRKRLLTLLEEENAGMYVNFNGGVTNVYPLQEPATYKRDLQQTPLRIVFLGAEALQQPAQPAGKLQYVPPALPEVIAANALSWTETESIRTQYTGGREYFLFTGDIDAPHKLVELLKAFSLFKKRQQSNMQLVLAGYDTPWTDSFEDKLATYKYRGDVVLLKDLEWKETVRLAAAAYAMVYPSVSDTLPLAPLLALQAGVPLVASGIPVVRALGDVAEWVGNDRLEDGFSQAMMRLYKDESYKQQLVQQAKQFAGNAGRPRMLEAMGEIIGVYPLPLK